MMGSTRSAVLGGILASCIVTIFGFTTSSPEIQNQRRNVLTNFMRAVPKKEVPFDMSGPSISQLTQAHFEPYLKEASKNVKSADPAYNKVHQNQHPNAVYEPDPAGSNILYQNEIPMVEPPFQPEVNMGQYQQNPAGQLHGGGNAVDPQYPPEMNPQYPTEPPAQFPEVAQTNIQGGNAMEPQVTPTYPAVNAVEPQYPPEVNPQYPQEPPVQAINSHGGIPVDPTTQPEITPGYQPDPLGQQQVDPHQNVPGANVMPEVPLNMQEPPNRPPSVVHSVVHSEPPAAPFQVKLQVSSFTQESTINPFDQRGQQQIDQTLISEVNPAGPGTNGQSPAYPGTNAEPAMGNANLVTSLSSGGAVSPAVGAGTVLEPVPEPSPEPLPVSTMPPKPLTRAEKRRLKKLQRKKEREARRQKKLAARKAKKLKEQQRRLAKQKAKKLKEQQRRLARQKKAQGRRRSKNPRRSKSRKTQTKQV
ncbi:RNA-binding protein 33-like [Saccostrea echinata]|uniref:RNA-binding protein 33-like n=1 Tax=Saccostrea echinata TaxID=191078 RepID=UPI002A83BF08|nr:RNA-binding protein 33-like [Saccostrea echinata]